MYFGFGFGFTPLHRKNTRNTFDSRFTRCNRTRTKEKKTASHQSQSVRGEEVEPAAKTAKVEK